jgi:hypothetical protein
VAGPRGSLSFEGNLAFVSVAGNDYFLGKISSSDLGVSAPLKNLNSKRLVKTQKVVLNVTSLRIDPLSSYYNIRGQKLTIRSNKIRDSFAGAVLIQQNY